MSRQRALHPCHRPGCPELIRHGRYCPAHARHAELDELTRKRAVDARRQNDPGRGLYSSRRWLGLRAKKLKADPLCQECGMARATIVDHVLPWRTHPELTFAWDNLLSRCKPCHDRKTASCDGGFGNPRRPANPPAGSKEFT